MKYGFALRIAIPEEYWNAKGWSVLLRFNGANVNSGSFQLWNANFFNFFRHTNALEILIHEKHYLGNDLDDSHSFLLVVDKLSISDLRKYNKRIIKVSNYLFQPNFTSLLIDRKNINVSVSTSRIGLPNLTELFNPVKWIRMKT